MQNKLHDRIPISNPIDLKQDINDTYQPDQLHLNGAGTKSQVIQEQSSIIIAAIIIILKRL